MDIRTAKINTDMEKDHIDYLDPDDWDERPENICKDCGYDKASCVCKLSSYRPFKFAPLKTDKFLAEQIRTLVH